jgi:hypothetical protein
MKGGGTWATPRRAMARGTRDAALLQLTGRANYADNGKALGVDLVDNPTVAAQPALSLKIAREYWKRHNINADCGRDDAQAVTRKVNGGLNELSERIAFTQKSKAAVARLQAVALSGASVPGARAEHRDYGVEIVGAKALPGAAEGEDAKTWSGVLPATGAYLVVVGPTY